VRAQLAMEGQAQAPPVGALIFSCNGRGVGLFGEPDFDSRTLASFLPVPSSGFFCNGAPADRVTGVSGAASVEAAAPVSSSLPVIACCRAPSKHELR
jgi:small ligand-binding sensory domain FIST